MYGRDISSISSLMNTFTERCRSFRNYDIFTDRQHSEIYPLDGAAVVIVSRGSIALTKNTLHFELQGPASVFEKSNFES